MTDRKKPRGEMLMDIGAQAVKVERAALRVDVPGVRIAGALTAVERDKLQKMARHYLDTQKLET